MTAEFALDPSTPGSRSGGSDKTRQMLWALLAGPLRQDTERDLLAYAGQTGVSFSDEEAIGLVRANPNIAGLEEAEERGLVRQATVEEFLAGDAGGPA